MPGLDEEPEPGALACAASLLFVVPPSPHAESVNNDVMIASAVARFLRSKFISIRVILCFDSARTLFAQRIVVRSLSPWGDCLSGFVRHNLFFAYLDASYGAQSVMNYNDTIGCVRVLDEECAYICCERTLPLNTSTPRDHDAGFARGH